MPKITRRQVAKNVATLKAALKVAETARDSLLALYEANPVEELGDRINDLHDLLASLEQDVHFTEAEGARGRVDPNTAHLVALNID